MDKQAMDKHIMAQACPQCGGTEYYCAEEVEQQLAECRERVRTERQGYDLATEAAAENARQLAECREELAEAQQRLRDAEVFVGFDGDLAAELEQAWAEGAAHVAKARQWIERAKNRLSPNLVAQNMAAREARNMLNEALEELALATSSARDDDEDGDGRAS